MSVEIEVQLLMSCTQSNNQKPYTVIQTVLTFVGFQATTVESITSEYLKIKIIAKLDFVSNSELVINSELIVQDVWDWRISAGSLYGHSDI